MTLSQSSIVKYKEHLIISISRISFRFIKRMWRETATIISHTANIVQALRASINLKSPVFQDLIRIKSAWRKESNPSVTRRVPHLRGIMISLNGPKLFRNWEKTQKCIIMTIHRVYFTEHMIMINLTDLGQVPRKKAAAIPLRKLPEDITSCSIW